MTANPQDPVEACNSIPTELANHMQELGFNFTDDLGNGMKSNHNVFVHRKTGMVVFADQAAFFYRESKRMELKARIRENRWSMKRPHGGQAGSNELQERKNELEAQLQLMEGE